MDLPISPGLLISLIIVIIGILIISKGLVIVRQSEVMVIDLVTYTLPGDPCTTSLGGKTAC